MEATLSEGMTLTTDYPEYSIFGFPVLMTEEGRFGPLDKMHSGHRAREIVLDKAQELDEAGVLLSGGADELVCQFAL